VKCNIDVKVQNDPERLFPLMAGAISAYPNWQTLLAPRLLIGLWHPRFISPAKHILPFCRRSYIGLDVEMAKKHFWKDCDAFSVCFDELASTTGKRWVGSECRGIRSCELTVNCQVPRKVPGRG
jgi:phosphatidylglycerol phospholipase C